MSACRTTRAHRQSAYHQSHRLAERLEAMGKEPFRANSERYICTSGHEVIVELGRTLKETRFFPHVADRFRRGLSRDACEFVSANGYKDLLFWTMTDPDGKTPVDDLQHRYKLFNERLAAAIKLLRRDHGADVLLCCVHPRVDAQPGLIDLHAHLLLRVPDSSRSGASELLKSRFGVKSVENRDRADYSRIDTSNEPVRSIRAVVNYMVKGVYAPKGLQAASNEVLAALWEFSRCRFQLVRPQGSLARWRSCSPHRRKAEKRSRKPDGSCLSHAKKPQMAEDRFLRSITVRHRGQEIIAQLRERRIGAIDTYSTNNSVTRAKYFSKPNRHGTGADRCKPDQPKIAGTATKTPPLKALRRKYRRFVEYLSDFGELYSEPLNLSKWQKLSPVLVRRLISALVRRKE